MEKKKFKLKGKKDLIFLKNEDIYTVYDPIYLEYYEVDEVGAELLYLLSKNSSLDVMINYITDEYDISYQQCKKEILMFFNNIPIKDLIYPNLILNDIYLELYPFAEAEKL